MKKALPVLLMLFLLTGCARADKESNHDRMAMQPDMTESIEPPETGEQHQTRPGSELPEEGIATEPETRAGAGVTASDTTDSTDAPDSEMHHDIRLRASHTEILIGQDDHELIWYAEIPVNCEPETVYLFDADTGTCAAELRDEADYEKYGDTIKGDAVYNCRFPVNVDIDTDPEVSDETCYHYYAEFTENGITHRSQTVEIRVLEPFTDKELDDMEAVDDAISGLMQSEAYANLSDAEKCDQIVALLKQLAAQGTDAHPYSLIRSDSILIGTDVVSFQYTCGVTGGVKITDFHEMMN